MKKVRIFINDKEYICQVAKSEEDRKNGLMNVEYLAPDEGMLFVFDKEETHEMWMKNTKISLDQIGINSKGEVNFTYTAQPEDETLIPFSDSLYILEVNAGSEIKEGDVVDIDKEDLSKYQMKVLAPDGSTQMWLQGGERIISRKETLTLLRKIKKAKEKESDKSEFESLCKSVGRYVFKIIKGQDERPAEYVEAPTKKNVNETNESNENSEN